MVTGSFRSQDSESIDVLIATYMGEKYLADQIESLLNQSCKIRNIIICDDASTDSTRSIIEKFRKLNETKIIVAHNGQNRGVIYTFSKLLNMSTAAYIMFCDQDDAWNREKVELTFETMKKAELKYGPYKPILVHTDLNIVDENLELLHPSFWAYTKINPINSISLNKMLIQNCVTGCTVMINRPLVEKCGTIPKGALMHDWWLALVATAFGVIVPLKETTMSYRQHGSNVIGAKKFWSYSTLKNTYKDFNNMNKKKTNQAIEFYDSYKKNLSKDKNDLLEDFINLESGNFRSLTKNIFKNKFYRQGFFRNFVSFIFYAIKKINMNNFPYRE